MEDLSNTRRSESESDTRRLSDFTVAAQLVCAGPQSIDELSEGGDVVFYGWAILSLSWAPERGDPAEVRSVYANPFDTTQHRAILRGARWSRKDIRAWYGNANDYSRMMLPGKAVTVNMDVVESWLERLCGISLTVPMRSTLETGTGDRHGLRVELDHSVSRWEAVWQGNGSLSEQEQSAWISVWDQLGNALRTGGKLERIRERYWRIPYTTEFVLDSDLYSLS